MSPPRGIASSLLLLLALLVGGANLAADDFERVLAIRADRAIASFWAGNCPGSCNASTPWPGLVWSGANLTRLYEPSSDLLDRNSALTVNSTAFSIIHRYTW